MLLFGAKRWILHHDINVGIKQSDVFNNKFGWAKFVLFFYLIIIIDAHLHYLMVFIQEINFLSTHEQEADSQYPWS